MVHTSDLPAMSGLGSSSAFTVGFLHSLYALTSRNVNKKRLALEAIHVEQERIKENVGSQDQIHTAVGGFNSITFNSDGIHISPVKISKKRLEDLEDRILLFFAGFPRNASEFAAEQIKNTPQKTHELNAMVSLADEAKDVLSSSGNLDRFGILLDQSWQIKKSLSSKITNPFIDEAYEIAKLAGALGGKLLGAGGGGFMIFYAPQTKHEGIKKRLKNMLHVPFKFENKGTQIIYKNV